MRISSLTRLVKTSIHQSVMTKKKIPKYRISKKDDLKKLILNSPTGIEENSDLEDCYQGVVKDLESLKQEGWIRVIKNNKTKKNILFPIDLSLTNVEVR